MSIMNYFLVYMSRSVNMDVAVYFFTLPTADWVLLFYLGGEKYHEHCSQESRKAMIMISCDRTKTAVTSHSDIFLSYSSYPLFCLFLLFL